MEVNPQNLSNAEQYSIAAGVGVATGFFWSVVAGEADLETPEGWIKALFGGAGGGIQSTALMAIGKGLGDERAGWGLTTAWWGAQLATSFTNWLGHKNGWEEAGAYQAVAIPLNWAASPFYSTGGFLLGLGVEAVNGFSGEIGTFAGMVTFDHQLCPYGERANNLGAVGFCFGEEDEVRKHEAGHQVQMAAMGELGMTAGMTVLAVVGTLINADPLYSWVTLKTDGPVFDPWAEDYSRSFRLTLTDEKIPKTEEEQFKMEEKKSKTRALIANLKAPEEELDKALKDYKDIVDTLSDEEAIEDAQVILKRIADKKSYSKMALYRYVELVPKLPVEGVNTAVALFMSLIKDPEPEGLKLVKAALTYFSRVTQRADEEHRNSAMDFLLGQVSANDGVTDKAACLRECAAIMGGDGVIFPVVLGRAVDVAIGIIHKSDFTDADSLEKVGYALNILAISLTNNMAEEDIRKIRGVIMNLMVTEGLPPLVRIHSLGVYSALDEPLDPYTHIITTVLKEKVGVWYWYEDDLDEAIKHRKDAISQALALAQALAPKIDATLYRTIEPLVRGLFTNRQEYPDVRKVALRGYGELSQHFSEGERAQGVAAIEVIANDSTEDPKFRDLAREMATKVRG